MISDDILEYLRKVCIVLHRHKVTYLIVGGVAVNHYGLQRISGISNYNQSLKADLGFWYQPTISNFNKLVDALADLDVDTAELQKLVFDPKKTFLKIPHNEFHTDFLPALDGFALLIVNKRLKKLIFQILKFPFYHLRISFSIRNM